MKIRETLTVHAGGPGSGCNPDAGKCGRPLGKTKSFENPPWSPGINTDSFFKKDGHYVGSRLRVHNKLVEKYESKPAQTNPVIQLVAGGMASGKSGFEEKAQAMLRNPAIINSDIIRADLPEYKEVIGTRNIQFLLGESNDVRDAALISAVGHNNDIQISAPGSLNLNEELHGLDNAGYKTVYTYVHRPVEESIKMANYRAENATNDADRRPVPEEATRASHEKARTAFAALSFGRETKVFDGSGRKMGEPYGLIFHRAANGTVLYKDAEAMRRFMDSEEPKIKLRPIGRTRSIHSAKISISQWYANEFRSEHMKKVRPDLVRKLKATAPNQAALKALLGD